MFKNCKKLGKIKLLFQQFLDVFSSHDDWTNFSSFALCQASQDKSLEYPQRVLWGIFFPIYQGVWAIFEAILVTLPVVGKI